MWLPPARPVWQRDTAYIGLGFNDSIRCHRNATTRKVRLFTGSVLGNSHCSGGWCHPTGLCQGLKGVRWHIFKLGRETRSHFGQLGQTDRIRIRSLNVMVADTPGRAGRVRVEHSCEVAHLLGCVDQHAPELPAPQHAQRQGFGCRGCNRQGLQNALPVIGKAMLWAF